MEFTKVTALTPDGEPFDSNAVGEGVWLSVAHLNAIESQLAAHDAAMSQSASNLSALNEQMVATKNQLDIAEQVKEDLLAMNRNQEAKIAELNAEIEVLGKQPSGNGSNTNASQDPNPEPAEVPSYLDDASPINAWIDQRIKKSA